MRVYNADGFEFMTLKSDDVSTRFNSLFGEKLVGARHAEPVDLFPFADVQVGPNCESGRRITAVVVEYGKSGGAVRRARDGDPALLRGRSRPPALSMTRRRTKGENNMIGTYYTPGLLAELAKKPNVRSLEIPVTPKGQWVSSCTKRYTDNWVCKTTLFDVGDVELASVTAEYAEDSTRFGLIMDHEVEKVTVSSQPAGLCVSFVVSRWFEEGLDEQSVVLSPAASVELKSEIGAVSVIEETYTDADKITSFFEDETSDEPWLVIVEPY